MECYTYVYFAINMDRWLVQLSSSQMLPISSTQEQMQRPPTRHYAESVLEITIKSFFSTLKKPSGRGNGKIIRCSPIHRRTWPCESTKQGSSKFINPQKQQEQGLYQVLCLYVMACSCFNQNLLDQTLIHRYVIRMKSFV